MEQDTVRIEQVPQMTEAVRQFAALPPNRQEAALLIVRGIQIGEDIAKHALASYAIDATRPTA